MDFLKIIMLLVLCQFCFAKAMSKNEFIKYMESKHSFNKSELKALLNITPNQKILKTMKRPAEKLDWHKYKKLFLTKNKIEGGAKFIQEYKTTLADAEAKFGVPAEIITAILGVETSYGKIKSMFPVIEALTTLGFHYPRRAEFFQKELEQFLLLTKKTGLDAKKVQGSYAGAIGIPQFMPSSYLSYAISFKNSAADLNNNMEDAIYSVANYLKKNGWKAKEAVAMRIKTRSLNKSLALNNPKPSYTVSSLKKNGVLVDFESEQKYSVMKFKEQKKDEYWLGLNNFYTITRYNSSNNYAMAVYLLGENIKEKTTTSNL